VERDVREHCPGATITLRSDDDLEAKIATFEPRVGRLVGPPAGLRANDQHDRGRRCGEQRYPRDERSTTAGAATGWLAEQHLARHQRGLGLDLRETSPATLADGEVGDSGLLLYAAIELAGAQTVQLEIGQAGFRPR
jgi:hypothetical protein